MTRREFLTLSAAVVAGGDPLSFLPDELADLVEPRRKRTASGESTEAYRQRRTVRERQAADEQIVQISPLFLTFDDGPVYCTGRILDLLASNGHKATFFVIGRNLEHGQFRQHAVRAVREGHDLGNHSYTHPDFSHISAKRAEKEIRTTHAAIQEVVEEAGEDPKRQNLFFRFPYGSDGSFSNWSICQEVLADLDYRIAHWDLDTNDWRMELSWFPKSAWSVIASLNRAEPRKVVLLHDRLKTAQCLEAMLHTLDSRGLVSIPLSDCDLGVSASEPSKHREKDPKPPNEASVPDESGIVEELLSGFFPQRRVRSSFQGSPAKTSYSRLPILW